MNIIIVTCDAFQHLVPLTVKYLRRSFSGTLPGDIIVVTNHGDDGLRDLQVHNLISEVHLVGPDRGWSNNMINFLRGQSSGGYPGIECNEPFMLVLEDYIFTKVNRAVLQECIDAIEMYDDVGMVRLVPIPGPTIPWNDHRGQHRKIGRLDKTRHTSYCMSLQAAMWKPQTLLETLEPDQNPWKTEGRGSRRIARGQICQHTQFLCTYTHVVRYKNLLRRGKPDNDVMKWLTRQGENVNAIRRRS